MASYTKIKDNYEGANILGSISKVPAGTGR
jgi:hypothetical protein